MSMTTEVTTGTTNTDSRLTKLTLELYRNWGKHNALTGGDYYLTFDHEYEGYFAYDMQAVAKLLEDNPHIDGSFEMLSKAEEAGQNMIEDMHENRETQETEADNMLSSLSAYRVILERLGMKTTWVDEIEAAWR